MTGGNLRPSLQGGVEVNGATRSASTDCIEQLGKDELGEYLGAFSPASMRGVNQALAIALALTHCPKVSGLMRSGVWFPGAGHGLAAC